MNQVEHLIEMHGKIVTLISQNFAFDLISCRHEVIKASIKLAK